MSKKLVITEMDLMAELKKFYKNPRIPWTQTDINFILKAREDGYSYATITKILSKKYGRSICDGTVMLMYQKHNR